MTCETIFQSKLLKSKTEGIKLKQDEILNLRERCTIAQYICDMEPNYMVTLTYRKDPSKETIRGTTKGFCMRINEELFGSKGNKAVDIIIVIERITADREHLHIALKDPTDNMSPGMIAKLQKIYGDDFLASVINKAWLDAGKKYGNITGAPDSIGPREKWFRPVDDITACSEYMLKELELGNNELVDWNNTVTNGRRIKSTYH